MSEFQVFYDGKQHTLCKVKFGVNLNFFIRGCLYPLFYVYMWIKAYVIWLPSERTEAAILGDFGNQQIEKLILKIYNSIKKLLYKHW